MLSIVKKGEPVVGKTRSWKVRYDFDLESPIWNCKVRAEVWKFGPKVGKYNQSWKVIDGVGKFWFYSLNFRSAAKLSNFRRKFPNSIGSFQPRAVLSHFSRNFPAETETFQLQTFELKTLQLLVFQLPFPITCIP